MTIVSIHSSMIKEVVKFEDKEAEMMAVDIDEVSWYLENKTFEIKVGNEKAKVKLYDFMVAFKEMLEVGTFEMDEIDSAVWKIESKLEETQEKLDSAMDLIESRGSWNE